MNPEQTQQLKFHVDGIAQILHADAESRGMKMRSLGEIEETVRTQMHKYVSPQLGIFLSTKAVQQTQDRNEN
jgi:hypothetical protein